MTDLSKAQSRTTERRDRQLGRRTAILPERRNQQPVRTENSASIRDARRGDVGGAEALLQISRQVNGAMRDVKALDDARWLEKEQKLSTQGTLDAAKGEIDEALAAENESYNRAVRMGQVRQRLAGALPKTTAAIEEAIAGQQGMKLEDRLAGVDAAVEATFRGALLDEEGQLMDFGTAEANVYAANKLQAVRAEAQEKGYAKARTEMDGESVDNFVNFMIEAVRDGEVIDMSSADAILTPTADRDVAKARAFRGIEQFATTDPEAAVPALERLLTDMEEGEDAGYFDAEDGATLALVLERATDARRIERDRIKTERYEATSEELFDLYNEGKLTPAVIKERRDGDMISGRFARTMLNSLEADQRQREAEARARRAEARGMRMEALAQQAARRDREIGMQVVYARAGLGAKSLNDVIDIAQDYEERGMALTPSQIQQLYGASEAGAQTRRERPDFVQYASRIDQAFGIGAGFTVSDLGSDERGSHSQALDLYNYYVVDKGLPAATAYSRALNEAGRGGPEAELRALEAERPKE